MKPIVQDGHPALRQIAQPVPERMFGSEELTQIVHDMHEALDAQSNGVALAAPQVAIPYRIFVVRYDRMRAGPEQEQEEVPERGTYINPEFVNSSRKREEMSEGCLSVNGVYGTTFRHERASVRAKDENGRWFERGGGGILAQAFQHEIDHLDGILFTDHAENVRQIKESDGHE